MWIALLTIRAAQAHAFGLEWNRALASVTTQPATVAGLDHRLGFVRHGYDADIIVWDSFPLAIGATPKQTYIDGIPQLIDPHVVRKPAAAQKITPKGDYDKEAAEAVESRGDPDLRPKHRSSNIVFQGVSAMYLPRAQTQGELGTVVVKDGEISCVGKDCAVNSLSGFETIDLKGGSLAPGLISFGSNLGLIEIAAESATSSGQPPNILSDNKILSGLLVHAADGAQFGGKDELMALREGITTGVTPPSTGEFLSGLSFSFSLGAAHALEKGAIGNPAAALHIRIVGSGQEEGEGETSMSVATAIAALRRLLHGEAGKGEVAAAFARVANGELRLVVTASSADTIAALIRLKRTVPNMRLTINQAHEAWLLADELAAEDIGVIVSPPRSFPASWDQRRILPGPPLTNMTLPAYLHTRGVKVGLGIREECDARLTRFESAMAYASAPTTFSRQDAIDLVSANLVEVLGLNDGLHAKESVDLGFVAYEGDMFSFEGRVRAVRAPGQDAMDLFV